MDGIVTLEAAQALKDVGLPQDEFPTLSYWWSSQLPTVTLILRTCALSGTWGMHITDTATMIRAPIETVALDWLAKGKGYIWYKQGAGQYGGHKNLFTQNPFAYMFDTPCELIIAICQHIKETEDASRL